MGSRQGHSHAAGPGQEHFSHTMVSPRLTLMLVLITASILSLPAEARRKAPGGRCGLSCYRWKKCKGVLSQLTSGDSAARPGQRGTTGQLIFSKCEDPPATCECQIEPPKPTCLKYLLGSLLLLLLLFLGLSLIFFCGCFLGDWFRFRFFLLFLLLGNKEDEHLLGLDHVVLINVELTENIINFGLGHLVSPSLEGVLEHLDVNLALGIVGLESLDDEVVGVVTISSHLLLEHLNHVIEGAGSRDLSKEAIKLTLRHQHTNGVESTAKVIFVDGAVLVDVHELEALFVHLDLFSGETALILALSHSGFCL